MRSAPVPDAVRDELARRYGELGEEAGIEVPAVAVRSSALGEDSQDATFAGQQETYLWMRGADRVCDAVRDCWVSLSPPAIAYRARLGQDEHAMGVTVQLMVDAEVSGVMFTCNPVSGDPSMVAVNASWGLRARGGGRRGDTRRLPREQGHRRGRPRARPPKDVEYVPDAGGRGAVRVDVPEGGERSPASTGRRSRRSSTSAAASSGTSAATRTSNGRSPGDAGSRTASSSSSRGP